MSGKVLKRFYSAVSVEADEQGWAVLLDGRPIKTPGLQTLNLPTIRLAEAVAEEWTRQGETVDVLAMHITRLVNVALDRASLQREAMLEEVVRYCETDLLCFLAETPSDLRARQIALWRPIREWAGKALNVVLMEVPGGLLASPQPPASLATARAYAGELDNLHLTGLNFGLGLYGSALLALAVCEGYVDAQKAYEFSILDEIYQAERWGSDEENEARLSVNRAQAKALAALFSAL